MAYKFNPFTGNFDQSNEPEDALVDATTTANTIYVGRTASGTSQSAASWTIVRTTYSAAGIQLTKGTATGVTWTGRTGHSYT